MPKFDGAPSEPTDEELTEMDEDRALELALAARAYPETEEEKATALSPLAESPALNRLMIRNGRKSFNEIAQITGIPVGEVQERMSKLLDNRSWRDDLMEEKLILAEIAMQVDDIRNRMQRAGVEDEAWASMARVQLQASKTLLEQLSNRRKATDGQLALVNEMQARLMASAIELAKEMAIFSLQKNYPEYEPTVIRAAFDDALPAAIATIEAEVR